MHLTMSYILNINRNDGKLLTCGDVDAAAATHNSSAKKSQIEVTWSPGPGVVTQVYKFSDNKFASGLA